MACLIIIECVRLYLGYLGNLSEKVGFNHLIFPLFVIKTCQYFVTVQVPELAGFWVLSIVLQLPLHLFLVFCPPVRPLPAECAVECVMIFLLASQLLTGFFALRKSALHQARRYHLAQIQNESRHKTCSD